MPAVETVERAKQRGGRGTKRPEIPEGQGEVILIAEDEPSVLETTKTVLELEGYRIITANNGAEALDTYAHNREIVSLVLLDMIMPVMDGATTAKALRKINPNVRIISVSGYARVDDHEKYIAGAEAFLTKPYKADELLKTIHRILTT